ncbi:MAG TPA: O-antigen ligase family protein [Solirubrobacterales bacterium]|jgi:O-antigen ligase|nr:O-antigen ligase family protein [Solirubrobacterales bacterium]
MAELAATLRGRGNPTVDLAALAAFAATIGLAVISLKFALAFVGLIAVAAGVLLYGRPAMVVPLLVFSVYFGALHFGALAIGRLVGPVALLATLLAAVHYRDLGIRGGPIHRWIAVYGTIAVASLYWTTDTSGTISLLVSLLLAVTFALAVTTLTRTRTDLKIAMTSIPLVGLALAATGIVAFFAYDSAIAAQPLIGDRNFFAAFLVVAAPPTAILAIHPRAAWHRPVAIFTLASIVIAVVASGSQGGMLSLMGIVVISAIVTPPAHIRRKSLPVMLIAAPLLIALFVTILSNGGGSNVSSTGTTSQRIEKSSIDRVNLWRGALHAYAKQPATGIGYGAYAPHSAEIMLDTPGVDLMRYNLPDHPQEAHNSYVEALAELGPLGLVAFLGMIGATGITQLRLVKWGRRHGDQQIADTGAALFVSLCGFAIASFFLSVATTRCWWLIFGLTIATAHMVWTSGFGHGTSAPVTEYE